MGKGGGKCYFIAEVHMTFLQKFLYLWTRSVETGEDGENRFLAFMDFLVEHIVGLIKLHQAGGAENHHNGIDILELVLAIVNGDT